MSKKKEYRNAWSWVPSLYYAEGIPYVMVMLVSVIMYKRLGVGNADIALYTSWLYLPWVIKPLWSPFIDLFRTKRFWIVTMQLIIGACLAGVAFTLPAPSFLQYTLAFFFLMAFSSATHDIAADGFYMLGLSKHEQALHVGIRSTFYRLATITGQGVLIILAGYFETHTGLTPLEVQVNVKPGIVNQRIALVDTLTRPEFSDSVAIKALATNIETGNTLVRKSELDTLIRSVQKYNIDNGFNKLHNKKAVLPPYKYVASDSKNMVGNYAVIAFYLSKKPAGDKEYVMNVDFDEGDKSISLIEGSRLVFNQSNWNKPSYAVVQIDQKLKNPAMAKFKAIAGDIPRSWSITFWIITALMLSFFLYHFFILPYPVVDKAYVKEKNEGVFSEFLKTFSSFFKKKHMGLVLTFLLIYRFGEAQLIKLASPFLLDGRDVGGLGLTTGEVGLIYGTIGVIALTVGGIIGGVAASKGGLKKWIWWMFAAMNIPHLLYIYMAYAQPSSAFIISLCVAGEQFGYGFGFTAYMLYMIYVSEGEFKTAHYAICTGFMALSMMVPGMFSGYIQEFLGYKLFFIWILFTMIPGFFITKFIPIDPTFGRKDKVEKAN